ncbi:MAG: zinc ribbon domain-containing protein [Firmicutes bacterium]|nr:zinc ribbon domain-containing protein [Bacillota bacterium]
MICKRCGKALPDDSLFCQYCGAHFEDLAKETIIVAEAETSTETPEPEPVAAAEPIAEPEPPADAAETKSAPEEKPAAMGNIRYCQKCGGIVDPETKKCTKCGKQYFKFPTKNVLRGLVAALIIAMGVGLVYLYNQNQALAQELGEREAEVTRYKGLYDNTNKEQEYWRNQYSTIKEKYSSIFGEYKFYHDYAVIVGDDATNYHKYGCDRLFYDNGNMKVDGFWIYNSEAAKGLGFDPCSECP